MSEQIVENTLVDNYQPTPNSLEMEKENINEDIGQQEENSTSKSLPSIKDFPALCTGLSQASNTKVLWGPNMKQTSSYPSSSSSLSINISTNATPMRSKTIQEVFSLELQAQFSITKPEFSRIVQSVKQTYGVSVESTISKTSRTFLVSGSPSPVHAAKRELIKKLTKPITVTIEVPSKTRYAIIGSGGRMIKEILISTGGVKIDIGKTINENSYDEDLDDSNIDITLCGDVESVSLAKEKILSIVKEETKNSTTKFSIENKKIIPFIRLEDIDFPDSINKKFIVESGDIILTGPRDDVKLGKIKITNYLNEISNTIIEKKVNIPMKFQFLIDVEQIREDFQVVVSFPTKPEDESISFVGLPDRVNNAIEFSRQSSKAFIVESLEISKAHGNNINHAKNVMFYLSKYEGLKEIETTHPSIRIILPPVQELLNATQVIVRITGKSEFSSEIKSARKEIINLINELTPDQFLEVTDLNYTLFHKDIKHILLGMDGHPPFVQLGDYYPDNDSLLLIAKIDEDDFKPLSEELRQSLQNINQQLDSLRIKQSKLASKVIELPNAQQDELLGNKSVTLPLIMDTVSHGGEHIQINLHTPTKDQVTIRGDIKLVDNVFSALQSIILNPGKKSKMSFTIPTNTVSRLIGQKGSNMQFIHEKFQCQIDISQNVRDSNTEITLIGLAYNLEHAKVFILSEAKKWADVITKELYVPTKFQKNLIGSQGSYRIRLENKYNVRIQFPKEGEIVTIKGPSRGVNKAFSELKALLDFEIENSCKSIIKVPIEHISRVIGKNGDVINDIRVEFGVELNVLQNAKETKDQGLTEIELEIIGSKESIKDAVKKVENIVADASNYVSITLDIDEKYHRDIVGPGGSKIKEIIFKSGGDEIKNKTVDIPNSIEKEKVITVTGPKSFVDKVVKEINLLVSNIKNSITKEVDIPQEKQGALIGPGGIVRQQLEREFNVRIHVPNKDDKISKVTISGLSKNVNDCEKKILSEIIKDTFDLEINVPSIYHEFVSDRGSFIQKCRADYFINIKHGNLYKLANKLSRSPIKIPQEIASGSSDNIKFTIEQLSIPEQTNVTIPWRLAYEPVDLSEIFGEDHVEDVPNKSEMLDTVKKLVDEKIKLASKANYVGYIWSKNPKNFNKIIGMGGSNIKKIKDLTGTLINVPKKSENINDVVYIRGPKENVERAGELIVNLLK